MTISVAKVDKQAVSTGMKEKVQFGLFLGFYFLVCIYARAAKINFVQRSSQQKQRTGKEGLDGK
jgi:hypothetical protein